MVSKLSGRTADAAIRTLAAPRSRSPPLAPTAPDTHRRNDGALALLTGEEEGEQEVLRLYAQIVGLVLILIGVVGLFLGERSWLGVLNVDILEDIVHLVTGALLALVGFWERGRAYARGVVGTLGVIYLLVGVLGFVTPTLFGLLPHGYSVWDNVLHLALGVLSVALATYSGFGERAGWRRPGTTSR